MKDIVPWHCHVCGHQFETPAGGICKKCKKPTCSSCLKRTDQKANKSPLSEDIWPTLSQKDFVCSVCLQSEE